MDNALILMTRVPLPGMTKTRLMTHLTPKECALLHQAFIKDIYGAASKVHGDVFVFYTPERHEGVLKDLLGEEVRLLPQGEGDLGSRMLNAINTCLEMGYKKCVLIGTDIPAIKTSVLTEAFASLDKAEAVIAPTLDGGYYLIGMNRAYPCVFQDTFYGVSTVYERTLSNMKAGNVDYRELERCSDIDTYEDLLQLAADLKQWKRSRLQHTEEMLRSLGVLKLKKDKECELYG